MGACGATAENVKRLLPPRQSRGISFVSLGPPSQGRPRVGIFTPGSGLALILAHVECDEESNEIPAVQKLTAKLGLPGSLPTVDAMHCQKPSKRRTVPALESVV
jgi:hypothetical protein